jgi:pilus assembly protein CpaF
MNIEGAGAITQRDLVINALRMRPDRIIVGECRGPEAFDMMQAMNTGHDGSMTTTHANSSRDAFARMETMVMMATQNVPDHVIRQMLASAIQIVIHCSRLSDGTRKITSICEVTGSEGEDVEMKDVFVLERTGVGNRGNITGRFKATGLRPKCLDRLKAYGVHLPSATFTEVQELKDK